MHKRTEWAMLQQEWKEFERSLLVQHFLAYLIGVIVGMSVIFIFVKGVSCLN